MAVLDAYKNLALAQVATPPSPPATGTSLTLTAGQAANLPAPPFNATVFPVSALPSPATAEIVRVTAIAGDVLTITRVQEGTTARTVLAGDYLAATFTTKFVTDLTDSSNQSAGTLPDARLSANVALDNKANQFTQNQTIAGTRPALVTQLTGDTAPNRIGKTSAGNRFDLGSNLWFDGTNWVADDPTLQGTLNVQTGGGHYFFSSPVSANPRSAGLVDLLAVTPTGISTPVNVLINATRPDLQLQFAGSTAKGHIHIAASGQMYMTNNVSYDGTHWNLDDTSLPASVVQLIGGAFYFYTIPAGPNPVTVVSLFNIDNVGNVRTASDYYEKNRATPMGTWVNIPFNAANFTAASGSWVVTAANQLTLSYALVGKLMFLNFYIQNSTVTAVTSELRIALPGGFTAAPQYLDYPAITTLNAGAWNIGWAVLSAGVGYLALRREPASNISWSADTNAFAMGTVTIPLT